MPGMEWILECGLTGLLVATLFHALRLERALGVMKQNRGALEALVAGFNASTNQAEASITRLRQTVDGAGQDIAQRVDAGTVLKGDLAFLTERGDRLADRLETLIRAARPVASVRLSEPDVPEAPVRSQAERDLLKVLRMAR